MSAIKSKEELEAFWKLLYSENHIHFDYEGFVCPKCGWSVKCDWILHAHETNEVKP